MKKSDKASNNTCPLGTKRGLPAKPNRLCRRWFYISVMSAYFVHFVTDFISAHVV